MAASAVAVEVKRLDAASVVAVEVIQLNRARYPPRRCLVVGHQSHSAKVKGPSISPVKE